MNRRRITLGVLTLMLVAVAARPHAPLQIAVDLADAREDIAGAQAMVKVGIGSASLLVTWTQAAIR
jgi:hypothetical protein